MDINILHVLQHNSSRKTYVFSLGHGLKEYRCVRAYMYTYVDFFGKMILVYKYACGVRHVVHISVVQE